MARLSFFLLSALSLGFAAAEDLQDCNGARYLPSRYTCYDGKYLCPVYNGVPTLRCGDACYSAGQYSCNNGVLSGLSFTDTSYTLRADNPTAPFDNAPIEACSRAFWIGRGTCAYCPSVVGEYCATFPNDTRLIGSSGMSTSVPGGQMFYIDPTGALGYTGAHSAYYPPGSVFGVTAYKNGDQGEFKYTPGEGWYACPTTADANVLQIFQKLPGITLASNCTGLNILVTEVGGTGAWQYT
ncbi:hypothetical protein W97_05318 [Coniosporium apollinis CBS 100218]|uniref:Endo-1,3(4)-beta-glucanase 1 carbohydrate binding domain-containing protein n=1 Tax=Coniosporium apollinis (strain CBS 100218) TaxID=1168221 RepID=R7YVY2_CONA1|nr:uncharacterized protein W97_05318 [Coniosporium apollinis CBS 100218]EON66075.1 hypothetical protein W97_05318 [Coniosporium apollinis CBS 100218]